MKRLMISMLIAVIPVIAFCQNDAGIKATIAGYNQHDTIKIADCAKLSSIALSNKDYSVVSFTLLFSDNGYDYEYVSKSDQFTREMKDALTKLKRGKVVKYLVIKDIKIQSKQNNIMKIDNLMYKLKM